MPGWVTKATAKMAAPTQTAGDCSAASRERECRPTCDDGPNYLEATQHSPRDVAQAVEVVPGHVETTATTVWCSRLLSHMGDGC